MKTCSISGSTDKAVGPMPSAFTGTFGIQDFQSQFLSRPVKNIATFFTQSYVSWKENHAYAVTFQMKANESKTDGFIKKNSWGVWIIMPAPSPVLISQPHAPRCSIFSRMVSASEIFDVIYCPFILATKPIPHESCS